MCKVRLCGRVVVVDVGGGGGGGCLTGLFWFGFCSVSSQEARRSGIPLKVDVLTRSPASKPTDS